MSVHRMPIRQTRRMLTARILLGTVVGAALATIVPGPSAAAADSAAGVAMTQSPLYDLALTRAFLSGLLTTPPFDVWGDPKAQDAVREIEQQMTLLVGPDGLPLAQVLTSATALHAQALASATAAAENVRIDAGAASAALSAYVERSQFATRTWITTSGPEACVIAGISGHRKQDLFVGRRGDAVFLGAPAFIGALAPDLPQDAPAFSYAADYAAGTQLLERLVHQSPVTDPDSVLLHALIPDLATCHPRLSITVETGPAGWTDHAELSGFGRLPVRAISPLLLDAYQDHQQITVALAVSPSLFTALAREFGAVEPLEGAVYPILAEYGTGDLLVQGGWTSGLSPDVAVVALLANEDACLPAVSAAVAKLQGAPTTLLGTTHAWSIPSPLGPLTLATYGRRLVLATSDALASAAGTTQPAQRKRTPIPPWSATAAVSVHLDLPTLARQWLPMAYQLAAQPVELGDDPLQALSTLALNAQVAVPLEQMEQGVLNLYPSFRALFPGDAAKGLGAAIGSYQLDPASPQQAGHPTLPAHLLVMRTSAGYVVVSSSAGALELLPDLPAVRTALTGYALHSGIAAEHLPVVALPPRATFSARWLPPIPVALAHLRPYALELQVDGDRVHLRDNGLPVVPLLAMMLGVGETETLSDQLASASQAAPSAPVQQPAPAPGGTGQAATPPKSPASQGF